MKKQYLKYIILCLILLLCIIPNKIFAITSSGGYTIDNYTVNATYNSDNTIDVKEVIDVNFSSYRHGIYRNIPETMYINRDEKYKLKINEKHYNSSRSVAIIAQDELNSSSLFIPKKFYDTHEVIHKLCGMQLSNLRIARLTDYRTKMRRLPN